MKTFEELVPDLMGAKGLIGVPPEIAVFHLRKAAIELCERSHVWTQTLTLDVQAGVSDYPLDLADGVKLVAVKEVQAAQCRLVPDRNGVLRGCSCGRHVGCHTFKVDEYSMLWVPEPNEDAEQALHVVAVVKPGQDSCNFPDELYEDWSDTIAAGAAYRCFSMPKTEWYSAGMTTFYLKQFSAGVTRAKNKRVMQRVTGPLMMRGERF